MPVCSLSQRFSKWLGLAGLDVGVACAKNCRILMDIAGFRVKKEFPQVAFNAPVVNFQSRKGW